MSIINSVLGSLSPPATFRRSFEDPNARDHELPLYKSPPPRIPPPVTSSVLWSAPRSSLSPTPRVPDDLLAIQRRARHLEKQLQELLDAQADGLLGSLAGKENTQDDLVSNGSTTPTVSSVRSASRSSESGDSSDGPRRKKVGLNTARLGISRRMRQLAAVRAEELDLLDENLRDLSITVEKTEAWSQKRARLEKKIKDIESEDKGAKAHALQKEASKLEQDIRQKEEELYALKRRQRRVLEELADSENSMEARLSSYKTSLSLLRREVSGFLARPPHATHVSLSSSPYPTLPINRRTLDMAREYWQHEYTRLAEKCDEVDTDRGALEEGAVLWQDVIKKVAEYESYLQSYMQQAGRSNAPEPAKLLEQMDATIEFLEQKLAHAASKSWNLLVCAIGAELEAFKQGKEVLQDTLGIKRKGKEKAPETLIEDDFFNPDNKEQLTGSTIRIGHSLPPKLKSPSNPNIPSHSKSPPYPKASPPKPLYDTDDDDPDPELMISHQDTDTD